MTYRIIWQPPAFDAMGDLVREFSGRRAEFAAALSELSRKLSATPEEEGESREPPFRVSFFGRLTVRFLVAPARQTVYIIAVHLPFDRLKPE